MASNIKQNSDKKSVAIIGISGRFPGAENIDTFWENLKNGVESVSFFSDNELEASGVAPENLCNPIYVKAGTHIKDIDLFDADFFDITARDATLLDPQHRLMLECAWETLEHAGYAPESYRGKIGIFAGSRQSEYLLHNLPSVDMIGRNPESGPLVKNWKMYLDNDKGTLATRIAYKLDLKGPAISMQTACSTSLVALHMACQTLIREECDIMLAGGVCLRVPQQAGYLYSEGMIFSPDGHTRAFDEKGAGTVFSSAMGIVALKRLDRALTDNDCIHAVIRGSAVSNDGNGEKAAFTSPGVNGQVEAINTAFKAAEIDPGTISYVEAHGTATAHGDLAEMTSLIKVFRSQTEKKGFCALGSVKTNIGHPAEAAGITGLIKTVLMLKNRKLVPHLHFKNPNPKIDFENSPFYVNTKSVAWKSDNTLRRAGVNSFGVGGTNAHVVLEETQPELKKPETDCSPHILCLSAKNEKALKELIKSYLDFLLCHRDTSISDICFTANTGRTHFDYRIAFIADSSKTMQEKLSAFLSDNDLKCFSKADDGFEHRPSLNKKKEDRAHFLTNITGQYCRGAKIDWQEFYRDQQHQRVVLPTYPFQRKRYWIDKQNNNDNKAATQQHRFVPLSEPEHPLLGQRLPSALKEIQFESRLNSNSTIFLSDHSAFGTVILPATGYIEMATAAASQISPEIKFWSLKDMEIRQALILPQEDHILVQLILTRENTEYAFQILSLAKNNNDSGSSWQHHVTGKISRGSAHQALNNISLESLRQRCCNELSVKDFYAKYHLRGMEHGPAFHAIKRLWQNDGEALSLVELPEDQTADTSLYRIHPVLLDACLQTGQAAFLKGSGPAKDIYLPTILGNMHIYGELKGRLWSHAIVRPENESDASIRTRDFRIFDPEGRLVAEINNLLYKRATREHLLKPFEKPLSDRLYELSWQSKPLTEEPIDRPEQLGKWVIFTAQDSVSSELTQSLREYGERCITVFPGEFSESIENDSCCVDPLCPDDFKKLISRIRTLPGVLRGVVHLWGLKNDSADLHDITSLKNIQVLDCASSLHLIQSLADEEQESPTLCFVTRGTQTLSPEDLSPAISHSPLWGLGRVAAREHPKLRCIMFDLDMNDRLNETAMLFNELWSTGNENQIAFRQQKRQVLRLVRAKSNKHDDTVLIVPDSPRFRLEASKTGILNNLSFHELERLVPGPGEIEIAVRASGLNFRDVLSALGKYPGNPGPIGRECSGTVSAVGDGVRHLSVGDEVLAIASGSLGNYVITNSDFAVLKPGFLDFEEAACIPITFLTAYYGLHYLAKLKKGEKVLVHAASGGVGLAAAQLIKWAGAEIFATASHGKWEFLKSYGISHIMDSRSLDFVDEVMSLTNGKGVDIVFNSLAGDFIPKSLSVLGDQGRFLEIGKSGIWDAEQVKKIRHDISYFPFDLGDVAHNDPAFFQSLFKKLMEGFSKGFLKPLPQKRFPIKDSISAFRYMAQAKHIGKIVIHLNGNQNRQNQKDNGLLRPESTFLITGGLGALGLRVADWLAAQNAAHLVLLGRSEPSSDAHRIIQKIEENGTKVHVVQADVSNKQAFLKVLQKIKNTMPALRGIIHAAGVLDDGVLIQQSWDRFVNVMRPKIEGTWNLHILTKDLPLDFFVLFSSISSFWGSPGQGNYATANAFLDGLANLRRAKRLPCISINWGSWAETGMAADLDDRTKRTKSSRGLGAIDPERGLETLGKLISKDHVQTAVLEINWTEYMQQFSDGLSPPLFSKMLEERSGQTKGNTKGNTKRTITRTQLLQQIETAPAERKSQILSDYVKEQSTKILGFESDASINPEESLFDLGLDSLTAIELRNTFEFSIGCSLPATLIYDHPTIETLCIYLEEKIIPTNEIIDKNYELLNNNNPSRNTNKNSDATSIRKTSQSVKKSRAVNLSNDNKSSFVTIQAVGTKPPLFFAHGNSLAIHRRMGTEQPLYFLPDLWKRGKLLSDFCIEETAAKHIKELKTIQPEGPYFIGGYSFGGLLAFEMALQLRRQGEKDIFLFLLEPTTPVQVSSDKGTKTVMLRPKKNKPFSLRRKAKKIISNIIGFTFKGYDSIINSALPLPSFLRLDYQEVLYKMSQNNSSSRTSTGRALAKSLSQSIVNSGSTLPLPFRTKYVHRLYKKACNNYTATTYPAPITIYKVKQESCVNISAWEQITEDKVEIRELNLKGHQSPVEDKNSLEWTQLLENDLNKARSNGSGNKNKNQL